MIGGAPASMSAEQVANAWAEGLKALDHVHHQIGNLRTLVNGTSATVRCYGIALHHRGKISSESKTRRFVGTYEIALESSAAVWRITQLKFLLKFMDGDLSLESAL